MMIGAGSLLAADSRIVSFFASAPCWLNKCTDYHRCSVANNLKPKPEIEIFMSRNFAFVPRLMPEQAAAYYLGFSPNKLRQQGIRRRVSGGNRLYDIRDLDAWADNLRTEGETECLEQALAD